MNFEKYLMELCFDINRDKNVQDDDMPDFFDNWMSTVSVEDMLRWGQLYGDSQFINGMREVIN